MIAQSLYRMTGGHLGFLSRILYLYSSLDEITDTASFASWILSARFFEELAKMRGVPLFASFTGSQRDFCIKLLQEKDMRLPSSDHPTRPEIDDLIKNGTIATEEADMAKFSSPIIEYFTTYKLLRSQSTRNVTTLEEFIFGKLSALRERLLHSIQAVPWKGKGREVIRANLADGILSCGNWSC
jgi:hypothetical protein